MAGVKIQISENGPYVVIGAVDLVDHQGNRIQPPKEGVIALCRCGGSMTKPFCDGTHSEIGFKGAMQAVEDAEGGSI